VVGAGLSVVVGVGSSDGAGVAGAGVVVGTTGGAGVGTTAGGGTAGGGATALVVAVDRGRATAVALVVLGAGDAVAGPAWASSGNRPIGTIGLTGPAARLTPKIAR
jgi:hypothetical protein